MLPARNRMRRSADYRAAVRTGRRVGRASLVLHMAAAQTSTEPARVGFVVSRAVGPAVTRNLVKRRLREAVRARMGDVPAGTLLVVRANPAAAGLSWDGLCADLDAALTRVLRQTMDGAGRSGDGPRPGASARSGDR